MPPTILLSLIIGIPLLLEIFLRVKPLYLFVAIVTGYFWVQFLGSTAELIVRSIVKSSNAEVMTNVGLLFIPLFFTFLLMRKTLSTSSIPFQFVLLLADSILLATFLVPLLSAGTQGAIYQTNIGNIFRQSHDVSIAAIAGLHLLVMFFMRPKLHGKKHK